MGLLRTLLGSDTPRRSGNWSWDQYLDYFAYGGHVYPLGFQQTLTGAKQEIADGTFASFASAGYRGNGVVFACMVARLALFSEARFQFRAMRNGRPGDLFGTPDLAILEKPWYGGTTGDLLARMISDADLAGNAYVARRPRRLRRLRPDWVGIVMGSENDPTDGDGWDVDADVVGHVYWPGGRDSGRPAEVFLRGEVAHFAPIPDPLANFRGMSWITPIVREMAADSAARDHKLSFFENGATPNMVVRLDKESAASKAPQAFKDWVDRFRAENEPKSRDRAYKTMYLAGGADVTVVGKDLQQLDFKATQGAGETRIAAAAGMHPVIIGLSEGLAGSSLNAGNFQSARRLVADRTMRPLWRNVAGSLSVIVPPPAGSELWYDDRDIPFLAEDRKDAAEIAAQQAQTIRTLVDSGYDPVTVVSAVQSEDWSLLKHTGLFSVQLQPPMPDGPAPTDAAGRALAALITPHLPPAA